MSLEEFKLLDNEPFDKSIVKRGFLKVYHQQGATFNDSHQHVEFIFVEKKTILIESVMLILKMI